MRQLKKIILLLAIALFSNAATASNMMYSVDLLTGYIDDSSAFGGIAVGDVFSGAFGADSTSLATQVDAFSDTTIVVSDPADGVDFMFNFIVGGHAYSFVHDAGRDYFSDPDYGFAATSITVNSDALASTPANVTDILGFSINQSGDADSFELYLDTFSNSWSAYDPDTGYEVGGTLRVSQVPSPSTFWLLVMGSIGLIAYRKELAAWPV